MSKLADDILAGLSEALDHANGNTNPGMRIHQIAETIEPKVIRTKLRLTQSQMATILGTSASGYRKWEQGLRRPSGAARNLLRVMDSEPEAVLRALVMR